MRPIETTETNYNLGPPPGKEDEIGSLPCFKDNDENGTVFYSVWEPSEGEREAIAKGGNIRLGVYWIGGFPPVSLGLTHLEEVAKDE